MLVFALLVIAGVGVFVMRPEERARAAEFALRMLGDAWGAIRDDHGRPDPFRAALAARTRWPLVTSTIVVVNVMIFLLTIAGPGGRSAPDALTRWGASIAPLTTDGQWWRLLTAAFVHAGLLGLLMDLAGLTQAGILLERMLGHVAFATVYLACAALASAINLSADPMVVSAGASGAIFGIYGLLIAVALRGAVRRSPLTIPLKVLRGLAPAAVIFVLYNLTAGWRQTAAALVTFAAGVVLGRVLARDVAERTPQAGRVAAAALAALVIVLAIAVPLGRIADVRPEIARLIAVEDRTAAEYQAAVEQFKLGAVKAEALAQIIERRIVPELQTEDRRLRAFPGVAREQRPLVAAAEDYLGLRRDSWLLRARALHKSNMRLLRDADAKERTSLDALEKIKPASGAPRT